jgi:hypothetical protein
MKCLIPFLLLLVGCTTKVDPSKVSPVPAPEPVNLAAVGQGLDVIDSRVAASVVVSRELIQGGKPGKADQELSIAQSLLPKPAENDVAYARQRSEKASDAEYEAQRKKAEAKQKAMEDNWKVLETQVAKNKEAIKAKDDRIAELTAEVDRIKREADRNLWSLAGVAVAVAGALATAFASPKAGVPLMACGAAIGSFPYVVDSEYFSVIVGVCLALAGAIGIWFLWDAVRDRVNAPKPPAE